MAKELFIVGQSEDTEAEYGFRSDLPFTVLSSFEGEIYATEGFHTLEGAQRSLREEEVPADQITYL